MASEKNAVLLFTSCKGSEIVQSSLPNLSKIKEKGVVLSNVSTSDDLKSLALCGNKGGETLLEAARKENLVLGTLNEQFDICLIDLTNEPSAIDQELGKVLEVAERKTLIVLIADGAIVYYGINVAKGKVIEKECCPCTVAPTVAYIVNLPVPENSVAPVLTDVFKDFNFKYKEVKKLQTTIVNMEAAVERSSRKPWDKHDCA